MRAQTWPIGARPGQLILAFVLLVVPAVAGATAERHALVIGNGDYKVGRLKNPANDARDMAKALEEKGFEVTTLTNADQRAMEEAIRTFTRRLSKDSVGLFYFAGHGVEVSGENYLVPIGARIENETDVRYEAVHAGRVLDGMKDADNGLNLVVLDACRNNPYARGFRSTSRGLARMQPASGSLILYATEPGQVAADGAGRNGIFTEQLLTALESPGLTAEQVFKRTAQQVRQATGGRQTPWMEGVILGQFYFVPAPPGAPGAVPIPPGAPVVPGPGFSPEVVFWQSVERNPSRAGYEAYLRQWPKGRFAALARLRLEGSPGGLERRLAACRAHLQANRLTTPAGRNALECYETVLAEDAGNAEALKGLEAITGRYLGWAESNIARGQLAKAETYLERAKRVSPEDPRVVALGERLGTARGQAEAKAAAQAAEARRRAEEAAAQQAAQASPGGVREIPASGLNPTMVELPGGCFEMGSPVSEEDRDSDERQHRVCVEGFAIGKTEVTQAEWRAVMGTDPSYFSGCDQCPVEQVSWNDAMDFAARLSRATGRRYRLPTEAEWEYACRGGRSGERYCGGNDVNAVAWHGDNSGYETHPAGQKRANGWGLYDMSGNVWEWTCSVYDGGYGGGERRCAGQSDEGRRALRGGSWFNEPWGVRSADRLRYTPAGRNFSVGFRLAQDR